MRPSLPIALLVTLAAIVAGVPVTATGPPSSASAGVSTDFSDTRAPGPDAIAGTANATNYLTLTPETPQHSQLRAITLDASGSVAVDSARIETRFFGASVRRTYAEAPNETAARTAVRRSTARLADRIDRLVAREQRARQQYNTGAWNTRTYLRELAVVDSSARQLQRTVERLYTVNQAVEAPVDPGRLARLKARLLGLQGPVREAIATAMTDDEATPTRVFVRSSATGTVLATIVEDEVAPQYVREAYLGRAERAEAPDTAAPPAVSDIDAARERFLSLYPWATSFNQYNIGLLTTAPYYLDAGVYALGVNHPQGTIHRFNLEAYLDADTGEVFREYQYVSVANVQTRPAGASETAGVEVTVAGTYVGGPVRVRATDSVTGDTVDATVAVAGVTVGTTGSDGVVAALAPRETFPVTVTTDGATIRIEASLATDLEP